MDFDALHKTLALNPKVSRKRKPRKKRGTAAEIQGLTLKQRKFLAYYLDPTCKDTFLQATEAVLKAGYTCKTRHVASSMGTTLTHKPIIYMKIKEALSQDNIDDLIYRGIQLRLNDPMTPMWQPTADYVSKIRGDFAPEKHVNVNLTPEQRDEKYDEIMKLVEGKKKSIDLPESNEV